MLTNLFRGQASARWKTLPSIARIHPNLGVKQLSLLEKEIIQEYRKKEKLSKEGWDDMEVLAFARHHGAPTRLLDWTRNALIALWFAIHDKQFEAEDGKVLKLDVLTNNKKIAPASGNLWLETVENFTSGQKVISFTSSPSTDRIHRQESVFTIAAFDQSVTLQPIEDIFGTTREYDKPGVSEFHIPSKLKSQLRRTLSNIGLNPFYIFGGPDGLGKHIENECLSFFRK